MFNIIDRMIASSAAATRKYLAECDKVAKESKKNDESFGTRLQKLPGRMFKATEESVKAGLDRMAK